MQLQNVLPADIEKRSMEIIGEELGEIKLDPEKIDIVKRVIHTSADFDYARTLHFSESVVEKALTALKNGATIVTDTNMACSCSCKRSWFHKSCCLHGKSLQY